MFYPFLSFRRTSFTVVSSGITSEDVNTTQEAIRSEMENIELSSVESIAFT